MRRVISLWLPRLATDRLCRNRPAWRDSPLAVTREAQGQLRLTAVNRAALDAGLRPGLSLADARAILPSLRAVEGAATDEAAMLGRLARWAVRYTPWVSVDRSAPDAALGDGGLWLDATGCAHLFGGEEAMLADIAAALARLGFESSAAAAGSPGAAWASARYAAANAAWTVVPPGGEGSALAPLPVAALRLAPETVFSLDSLGLRRIGDLLDLPRAALAARFGETVAARLDQALGRAPEPVSPLPHETPHAARLAFAEPIGRIEDITEAMLRLLAELCAGLEHAGRGARRLILTLLEPNGHRREIRIGASRPSRDPVHLARLFAEHLDTVEAEFGFDAVEIHAVETAALTAAQTGMDRVMPGDGGNDGDVGALIDRLANRLGGDSVLRFEARESHLPERAVRPVAVLDPSRGRRRAATAAVWPHARPEAQPRPLRLLSRPEPIEAVAPVPDDPPLLFRWRRVTYRVARAEGPERLAPEWWLTAAADRADEAAEDLRDYYRIEDTAGRRFWLYRQGLYRPDTPAPWFMHGFFG